MKHSHEDPTPFSLAGLPSQRSGAPADADADAATEDNIMLWMQGQKEKDLIGR